MAAPPLPPPLPPPPIAHPNDPNVPLLAALPCQLSPKRECMAPPWFQGAIQQVRADLRNDIRDMLRTEILPDLKRLMNQRRGEGIVVPLEVVPFINGDDPTQPPHNLPSLHSANVIDNLNDQDLVQYLNGYGAVLPVGPNPHATNHLWKDTLKGLVGALV